MFFPLLQIGLEISPFGIFHHNADIIMRVNETLKVSDDVLVHEFAHEFNLFEDDMFVFVLKG